MKIRIIRDHAAYENGEHEVSEERGQYLISVGAAEKVYDIPEYVESKIAPIVVEVKKKGRKPKISE